jgi:2'-5' RNA ligase
MIRAFIAIDVPASPPLRPVLAALSRMGRAVRPVQDGPLHITLKFLGNIAPESVPQVGQAISTAVRESREFTVELCGLGAFPRADRPNVIWVGCADAPEMQGLVQRMEDELDEIGIPRESRAFHPHATLARVKARPPGELADLLNQHAATTFGSAAAQEIKLYKSELTPEGPRYTVLARIPLGAERS